MAAATLEVVLLHWKPRTLLLRLALPLMLLVGAGSGALLLGLPASASALPESDTTCGGYLNADASGASVGEPDLLDYSFSCSTPISAYTVVIDRVRTDGDNIDDFNPNPLVYAGSNGQVSTTESINCGGQTPSNGINCYALDGSVAGTIDAEDLIVGSVDPTSQYCSYLPKGAKPGTPAVPRAIVELIVTDNTGAEDGPFELGPATRCPKVPAVVPAKKAVKKTTKRAAVKTAKRAAR